MKKIMTLTALVCMLISMFTTVAFASVEVSTNKETVAPGEEVVITVKSNKEVSGIIAIAYELTYDTEKFEYVSMTTEVFDEANPKEGVLPLIKWDLNKELTIPTGTLTKVTFKALEGTVEGDLAEFKVSYKEAIVEGNVELEATDERYEALQTGESKVELEIHTHKYTTKKYNTRGHWTECACGETTKVVVHTYGAHDCDEKAKCTGCNYTKAAGEHTVEVIKGKDATCTEAGLTDGEKCSVCGEVLKAQEEIKALGHTVEVIKGKDATCTEAGLTDGEKCSVCGEVLKAQEKIPAHGHKAEVFDKNGEKCSVCGKVLKEPTKGSSAWIWILVGVVAAGGIGAAVYYFVFKKKIFSKNK